MNKPISVAAAVAALVLLGAPASAFANSEAGPDTTVGYTATVQGNTVRVVAYWGMCSSTQPMLRQNLATKEVVRLGDYCDQAMTRGYVDECVPKGDYLYGFATPLECCAQCAGTRYYTVVHVTTELPASCARTAAIPAPTAYSAAVPWPAYDPNASTPDVCPAKAADADGSSGCGVHDGRRSAVVGIQLFAAAVGLWLLGRRKRRR